MKELVLILGVLTSTAVMSRFGSPSAMEMDAAQWQRQAREEREQMTRELLTVRNDINDQLNEMEQADGVGTNKSGQHLERLRTRLENENRELHQLTKETDKLTPDAWDDVKIRAEKQIIQVKLEYLRVQERMEKMMSSDDKK